MTLEGLVGVRTVEETVRTRAVLGTDPMVQPGEDQLVPLPPHLPVLTLKLPQLSGARQSEIRSLESGR